MPTASSANAAPTPASKPCRVCSGFGEMYAKTTPHKPSPSTTPSNSNSNSTTPPIATAAAAAAVSQETPQAEPTVVVNEDNGGYGRDCPEDTFTLGRASWSFLHTVAAYYPQKPNTADRKDMTEFMRLVSRFYPCRDCGDHLKDYLKQHPVESSSQSALAQWMCQMHNDVNRRLGKPLFDCSLVDQRWHRGWDDGSCD